MRKGSQPKGRLFGKYSEEMFFEGDQSALNPARYLPTPFHTKFAQQRTALSQYIQQEAVGTRMRRWERPFHDFLMPYLRGTVERTTGHNWIPAEVEHRRDLDTLADRAQNTWSRSALRPSAGFQIRSRHFPAQLCNVPIISWIVPVPREPLRPGTAPRLRTIAGP